MEADEVGAGLVGGGRDLEGAVGSEAELVRHGLAVVEFDGGGDVRVVGAASDGALGVLGRRVTKWFCCLFLVYFDLF